MEDLKKKKSILIIGIVSLVIILLGSTYAFFTYSRTIEAFSITSGGACLTSSFGYSDLMEMVEFANAPILDKNQEFVLVVHNSKTRKALNPMILKTSNYKNINCIEALTIEDKNININII